MAARPPRRRRLRAHVKRAIKGILDDGPETPQERWENQGGYSPATSAAETAALVTGADIARANRDTATAKAWEATPKDGNPNAGTTYNIGDSARTTSISAASPTRASSSSCASGSSAPTIR